MLKSAHETRFERYQQLRREFASEEAQSGVSSVGSQARFAQRIGVSPKYLGHVQNGRRQIGDALARKMEVAFAKPENWMDTPRANSIRSNRSELQVIIAELAEEAASIDAVATHRALLAIVQGAA